MLFRSVSGETINAQADRFKFAESSWGMASSTRQSGKSWVVEPDKELWEFGNSENVKLGKGWAALTPISTRNGLPSAIFFNDSGATGQAFDTIRQDLIGVYCSLLGGIIERKRAEAQRDEKQGALQVANQQLEHQMGERERLTNGLTTILGMADELLVAPNVDTLWKRGVELARERLGVERCSIFVYDLVAREMVGTYGTSLAGNTLPFHNYRFTPSDSDWFAQVFTNKNRKTWHVEPESDIWEFYDDDTGAYARVIARGWVTSTSISSYDGLQTAVLFNDSAVSNKPVDLIQQELVGVFCSLLGGIIERKRAEVKLEENVKDLRVAKRMAEESSRIKSEFLATVSHELRTPLNAIIGFSDMLLMGMSGELNPKQRHKMDRLRDNGVRLLTLINNVLDLTRLEARRVEIVYTSFSIHELTKRVGAQVEVLAQQKGLGFATWMDPSMPNLLVGDEQRIEQLVVNLLSNAFKFTDNGSVDLSVVMKPNEHAWAIRVADTGIGIPPHALNMIFEEFRQVDGSFSRSHKGSGLGLAITRNLVHLMKGDIAVESDIGKGSVFTVTLPLVNESAVAVTIAAASQIERSLPHM